MRTASNSRLRNAGFEEDRRDLAAQGAHRQPLLVEEDGPVYSCAAGNQQFYVTPPTWRGHGGSLRVELDTTRPYEAWMKEVEANMAAR